MLSFCNCVVSYSTFVSRHITCFVETAFTFHTSELSCMNLYTGYMICIKLYSANWPLKNTIANVVLLFRSASTVNRNKHLILDLFKKNLPIQITMKVIDNHCVFVPLRTQIPCVQINRRENKVTTLSRNATCKRVVKCDYTTFGKDHL